MNNEDKIFSMLENITTIVVQIQSEQVKTNQRLDNLEQGQVKLEHDLTKVKHDLVELTTLTHGIIQHQNEDYALLQALDKKVDKLANISQAHEEKFQKLRAL